MRCSLTLRQTLLALVLLCGCAAAQANIIGSVLGTIYGAIDTTRSALYLSYAAEYEAWSHCSHVKRDINGKNCGREPIKPAGFDEWQAAVLERKERERLRVLQDGRPGGRFRSKRGSGKGPGPLSSGAVLPHPPGY